MTRTLSITSKILSGLAMAAALALIGLLAVVPRLTGGTWLNVLTGSMGTTIPAGSLVLVEPVDPAAIHPGDVITWQVRPDEATYITHRVVRVQNGTGSLSFVTKGDANPGDDVQPVPAGAVRGRVTMHVPVLGKVRGTLHGASGIELLAVGAGLALLVAGRRRTLRKRPGLESSGQTAAGVRPDGLVTP